MDDVKWMRSLLSHNVRMPLSIIQGYGDLLEEGKLDEDKQKEVVTKICGNIKYLSNILKLVIDNDSLSIEYKFETVDILDVIREVSQYVKDFTTRNEITVNVVGSKDQIFITADRWQFIRLFYNLFENSLKYMGKKGEINVLVSEADDGNILIVYKDNGKGMPAAEVEHVFEKGYRSRTNLGKPGQGMGMYFVYQIIEDHGGTINVVSDVGKGFTVKMLLPVNRNL
ncbi:Histidine kinase-, DNA gyrase B-, and HSP90-like ATPase [Pseudobutyrivibrio sp. JW11]|uniref:sensor histidine kinase n=1 Tax=Pseudobutyrivibrio sp. JW11 TaxID=1855302 RepID=UPI0008DFBC23|nr:HAMP domain-containing sensor histidine kinase [Pseudobutyrivibrio sp. JW11]SFN83079.1 Histidine kinase-, DNA gyrase B-, and HSP90-like ATPase [Pseudobutyrivibrio sp. JW11]